jgi:hypothetical protein
VRCRRQFSVVTSPLVMVSLEIAHWRQVWMFVNTAR